jgi:hypothetical protein
LKTQIKNDMAKKQDSAEDAETNKSIGSQMKSKTTQRERNLKVKREMIEKGERDEPTSPPSQTVHERNLQLKKTLRDENEKTEKGKGKGKSDSESDSKSGTKKG